MVASFEDIDSTVLFDTYSQICIETDFRVETWFTKKILTQLSLCLFWILHDSKTRKEVTILINTNMRATAVYQIQNILRQE